MSPAAAHRRACRRRVLEALYVARQAFPTDGRVWRNALQAVVGECIDFDLSYLVERGLVSEDGASYRITALGIDAHELED